MWGVHSSPCLGVALPSLPAPPFPIQAANQVTAPTFTPESDQPEAPAAGNTAQTTNLDPDDHIVDALRRLRHAGILPESSVDTRRAASPALREARRHRPDIVGRPGRRLADFMARGIVSIHRPVKRSAAD